jgi:hypothetical protein
MIWSLQGMSNALSKVSTKSLEFHNSRGDFERWAEKSLHDQALTEKLVKVRLSKVQGEQLRESLTKTVSDRFKELNEQSRTSTGYF